MEQSPSAVLSSRVLVSGINRNICIFSIFALSIVFLGFASAAFDLGKNHLIIAEPSSNPTSGTTYFAGNGIDIRNGVIQLEETSGSTLLGNFRAKPAAPHVSQDLSKGSIVFGGGRHILQTSNLPQARLRVEGGLPQWVVHPDLYDNGPIILPNSAIRDATGILSGLDRTTLRVVQLADVPAVDRGNTVWFGKVWFECQAIETGLVGLLVLSLVLPAGFRQDTDAHTSATGTTDGYLLSMQGTEAVQGTLRLHFKRPVHSEEIAALTRMRVTVGFSIPLVSI
jgi:hypothetical protein